MAGTLPLVRGTAQALYPVTRRVEFLTDVAIALNSSEQRFKRRPPLTRFLLPYSRINATDMQAFRAFHATQKGTFDSTWSFTLGTTTYSHLTFEDDTFTAEETDAWPLEYNFTLRARQTINPGQTAGVAGGSFPALANGAAAQLPFSRADRFAVLKNDNPTGPRYAWIWLNGEGDLTGFPSAALHGWTLTYPLITDAELTTLETFFRNQWGRWAQFPFTDPDTLVTYSKCRFDTDVMEIRHNAPNQNSCTLSILETN